MASIEPAPPPRLHRTAIVYDFDGTLAPGYIQEHSFMPALSITPADFWKEVHRLKKQRDADEILTYMHLMLEEARAKGVAVTRSILREHGESTPLFNGLDTWFDRINAHAAERQLELEHYVVSSGIDEMITGSRIARFFKKIFACGFVYNEQGEATWPAVVINYTTKTQFLFRINKGVDNCWDNESVNNWIPMSERPLPFSRMLFIGDGDTDIPSMKMVRHQGGYSIAVFDPDRWSEARSQAKIHRLISEDRCHFVAPADYSAGSQLEVTVKGVLGRFARDVGYRGE